MGKKGYVVEYLDSGFIFFKTQRPLKNNNVKLWGSQDPQFDGV